ncbi:MAG: zinc ribbon domain-containing protein [Clostridiales bacterium]|jgi:hypothetical protein|nr:zinc ribbon domain-containing protein [Clostridiales bacterium]
MRIALNGYTRIEHTRMIKKDLSRQEALRKRLSVICMPGLFILGLGLFSLSIPFAYTKWLWLTIPTGVMLCVGSFLSMIPIEYMEKRIAFLKKILEVIRKSEVIYLDDECFSELLPKQRMILAKRLTEVPMLGDYEFFSSNDSMQNCVLAKRSLYLSAERIIAFRTLDLFALSTRLTDSNLKVLESASLILPDVLVKESARPRYFIGDDKLVNYHKSKYVCSNYEDKLNRIAKMNPEWWRGVRVFLFGFGLFIASVITVAATKNLICLFGVGAAFASFLSVPFFDWVFEEKKQGYSRTKNIADAINKNNITDLAEKCFSGLTLEQRIAVCEKLILIGATKRARRVVGNLAVVTTEKKYTAEEVNNIIFGIKEKSPITVPTKRTRKEKRKPLSPPPAPQSSVNIMIPEPKTNCSSCGAAIRESARFCVHCGARVENVINKFNE